MVPHSSDLHPTVPAPAGPGHPPGGRVRWAFRPGARGRAALAALAALLLAAAAPGFVDGLPDVPLMPGLSGSAAPATVFDTPGGRIIEVRAAGPVEAAAVRAFYSDTLPQLGWAAAGPGRFHRADEVLEVQIDGAGDALVVQFFLRPH